MKLEFFSIANYRSIASAELAGLASSVVLVGPNNEGKSNILQALNACLTLLSSDGAAVAGDSLRIRYPRDLFDWSSDYPIARQESEPDGSSVFQLRFSLSEAERESFHEFTGSYLNGVLPIELRFQDRYAKFRVLKQGKGGGALTSKAQLICKFIARALDFVYVPAVRTAETSVELVSGLVLREFRQLEKNERYVELQREIESLQAPVLQGIADSLKSRLSEFLGPGLRAVSLALDDRYRYISTRKTAQITIDDGTPTRLERKGDGVKSLVAISLMIAAIQDADADKDLILLIEEPEAHLHPKAIHRLRDVLESLGGVGQLLITTHCPLLINRTRVQSNIVVARSKASEASSIEELRDALGVLLSDNLRHAAIVIAVEGKDDALVLEAILKFRSEPIREALRAGMLAFQSMDGASKLSFNLQHLQAALCQVCVVVDDDSEGRRALEAAKAQLLVTDADSWLVHCPGREESELEDLFDPAVYEQHFLERYSADVGSAAFKSRRKWSIRMRAGLKKCGKDWTESTEYEDKMAIARLVASQPEAACHAGAENFVQALVNGIERKLIMRT